MWTKLWRFHVEKKSKLLAWNHLYHLLFRMALVSNNNHSEDFNNLGVLEMRRDNADSSRALFNSAASSGPHLFEPNFNLASLASRTGDLQTSYVVVKKSLATFPSHFESKELLNRLNSYFSLLWSIWEVSLGLGQCVEIFPEKNITSLKLQLNNPFILARKWIYS